jgi:hypothetical protein
LWVKDSLEELLKVKNQVLHLTRGEAKRADQPKFWNVEEQPHFPE